jgi:hypothetical protein
MSERQLREDAFATALAGDLERVLRAGVSIGEIDVGETTEGVGATVSLLVEGRIETITVEAPNLDALRAEIVRRAAELRLRGAFWQMVGPS